MDMQKFNKIHTPLTASESRPSPPCDRALFSWYDASCDRSGEVAFDVNDCMRKIGNEALDTVIMGDRI